MAAPRKVGDKWRAQVQRDGVRVSKMFARKADAVRWLNEQDARVSLRSHTLEAAIHKYVAEVTPTKRTSQEWERRRLEQFASHFPPGTQLADIDQAGIGRWRTTRLESVSPSTVVREANVIRNMFRVATLEWRWIEEHPFTGVKLPQENAPRTAQWRWQQIKQILRAGQRSGGKILEVTQAFHIALRTALRLQEALQGTLDTQRRVMVLPATKTAARGEIVPLTGGAYRLLLKMPRTFTVGPNEASTLFSRLCREQLIDGLQFKDSRATALTLLARKVDVLTLAKISRHRNLELLNRVYYREAPEEISARLQGV